MEDSVKNFLLRIILVSIIITFVIARDIQEKPVHNHLLSVVTKELNKNTHHITEMTNEKHTSKVAVKTQKKKHKKKSKRDAYTNYAKYWAARSSNFGYGAYNNDNMPPYLVFNRKIGAYFPYYRENNVRRRNGNVRKSTRQYKQRF